MEILGYEIKRAQKANEQEAPPVRAAEPTVKQKTSTRKLGGELGDSGTEIYDGYISEEYNAELRNDRGVKIYDQMRKSDGTVRSIVLATSLPIRRASWFVKTNAEDAKSEEIREFVEKALFDWQSMTWDDFLRQALLMLPYGVQPFEKVFKTQDWNGQTMVTWKKLAPRDPKTIQSWELENGETGIQQIRRDGKIAEIPIQKLCVFVNEKEGENWWGTSVLRPAYKHWDMKNKFYQIDAIAFERQGIGVPYAKMPESYTDEDENRAKKILKNMRAHHNAHVIIPHDYEVGYLEMGSKSVRDPEKSIAHHNREITKAVLAQFLELGAQAMGSRALSADHSEIFLKSLESISNNVADVFNKYSIPQLVDLNYDNVEIYPELDYTDISRVDVKPLAEAYEILTRSGGIKSTEQDETYFRGLLGLPELTEKEREEREENKEEEEKKDIQNDLDLEDEEDLKKKSANEIARTIKKKVEQRFTESGNNTAEIIDWLRDLINKTAPHAYDNEVFSEIKGALTARLKDYERQLFQEENDFKGWRPLTFAEKKVNLKSINDTLDKIEGDWKTKARDILDDEKERYIKTVSKAIIDEDTDAIKKSQFRVTTAYTQVIKSHLKQVYEFGKNNASREMDVKAPANRKDTLRHIDITADAIVKDHVNTITSKAQTAIVEAIRKPDDKEEFDENKTKAIGMLGQVLGTAIASKVDNTAAIIFSQFLNHGRADVFDTYPEKIYALQRSEILDSVTCNYCLSIDGRIIEKDDPFAKNTIFHSNCRGIWVEILEDEEEKPKIDGIPKSLKDRFGDSTNELIQPKKPTTKKDSLARNFLKKKSTGR